MKLVHKMKIFFYPAILVPIFLIIVLGILVFHGYFCAVVGLDWTENDFLELLNPLYMGNEMIQETYDELLGVAEQNPEQFLDESYLAQIDKDLDSKNSFCVVKIEENIVHSGSESTENVEGILPYYHEGNQNTDVAIYVSDPQDYLIRQVNFKIDEEQKGSAYILCNVDAYAVYYRNALLLIILVAIVILVVAGLVCSRYIKRELMDPLRVLESGIEEIKKGNLKAEIPIDQADEIGDVAVSFNEMRDQLKKLIDDRLYYEEENRVLISNISHDLKTPITAIKGYVEGIMDGVATTPEMMDKYIKTIYVKADAMDAMLNELSIYSKIDNDTIPYDFKRLNLDSFFRDCIDDLSIDLESKNMEITYFNYCSKDLNVIADTEQLKRVITNIIMNSVKYNDKEKGRINIRIREDGDYVKVEIEDNGMGIDEKDLPYIFDRLFRADASRNSRLGGTGLGLSIAKKVIEEHGGKIWAKSRKNTGTIIIFTLEREKEGHYER